jgi:hypothetical protein
MVQEKLGLGKWLSKRALASTVRPCSIVNAEKKKKKISDESGVSFPAHMVEKIL